MTENWWEAPIECHVWQDGNNRWQGIACLPAPPVPLGIGWRPRTPDPLRAGAPTEVMCWEALNDKLRKWRRRMKQETIAKENYHNATKRML